ncbi:MAG: NADPH:quinone reductase [Pseudomonadota bacterium]
MKAVTYRTFGTARDVLRIEDLDTPVPADGEVLVELAYSGVNPSDIKARSGTRPGATKPPFEIIVPHSDGSGIIIEVGTGVDRSRIGERVWIWNGQWRRAYGTAASHIALPSAQAPVLPDPVSFETGAILGIPGLTACHTVLGGGPVEGATLLIHGGAGTVGFLAVQLARWAGAHVIATASPKDHDRVADTGAHHVLDYAAPDLSTRILDAADGKPVDRIVDVEFGTNIAVNTEVIAECGTIAAYGSARDMQPVVPFYPLMFKAATIDITLIYLLNKAPRQRAIEQLTTALSSGGLRCPVFEIFAMARTAVAHDMVESGGRSGAVLINVS